MPDETVSSETVSDEALLNALPILSRLRLSQVDKAQLSDLQGRTVGKVQWCSLAAAAAAIIAQLEASGVPIPPYITMVFSILSALCPNPAPVPVPVPTPVPVP